MKKRINLLNPEVIGASATGTYIKFPLFRGPFLLKVSALFLVVLALITVYQQTVLYIYNRKLIKVKKIYSNSQAELKQNKEIQARLQIEKNNFIHKSKSLQEKIKVLSNVTIAEMDPSGILAHMAEFVPNDMWISKIDLDKDKIKLTGKTMSNATVSDFMVKLDQSPNFENTTFTYTQKKNIDGREIIEFEIISKLEEGFKSDKLEEKEAVNTAESDSRPEIAQEAKPKE